MTYKSPERIISDHWEKYGLNEFSFQAIARECLDILAHNGMMVLPVARVLEMEKAAHPLQGSS